jgi:hypothetical protein
MKNLKRLIQSITLLLIFLPGFTFGQTNQRKLKIASAVTFENQSEILEIKFPVSQVANINLELGSNIYEGELTIELYDSKGEKQGNFTIGSPILSAKKDDSKTPPARETIRGSLSKRIVNPAKGEWIVKFIPKNVSGITEIHCTQFLISASLK